jgi:hypothetical protein
MIRAFAPRTVRGWSWVWLCLVLIAWVPVVAGAQAPKSSGSEPAAKGDDAAKKAADAKDEKAEEDAPEPDAEKPPSVEIIKDENASKLTENRFPQLPAVSISNGMIRQVESMAGSGSVDASAIDRYIRHFASDLTNHSYIQGVIDPPENMKADSRQATAFRDASAALSKPIETARRAGNTQFLQAYTRALLSPNVMPKLLSGHLFTRVEAMIVLAKTGHAEALDTFVKQINDEDQTTFVKLWAVRGITNLVKTPAGIRDEALGPKAVPAAKALVKLLADKDLPWPVQQRALEALGSLRLAADPTAPGKVEMAEAAMSLLADPSARPEVRAEAAWALGMMRVSSANGKFNFPLIAYYVGEVAADLGERVASTFDENATMAEYWTAPLLFQLYPALYGQTGARESGLLGMPVIGSSKGFVTQVAEPVVGIAKTSVELHKSPKGGRPKLLKELSDRVATLKTVLDKGVPGDKSLVPGGREFPVKGEMAGDDGVSRGRVAGANRPR